MDLIHICITTKHLDPAAFHHSHPTTNAYLPGLEKLKTANRSSHFRQHLRFAKSFLATFMEFAEQRFQYFP